MKISEESIKNLEFKGIYSITSKKGKRYIGSTKKSFFSRFRTHFEKLRSNNHMNEHLQNSWNKNGCDHFIFEILEVIECDFEIREKYWIEFYQSGDRLKGYNINKNPCKSPSYEQEVKDKISNTLKRKYKSGEIQLNKGNWEKGLVPWNKGKKFKSTDHLKVPKGQGRRVKRLIEDKLYNQVHKKQGELLENPITVCEDNQQPSLDSNIFEGSTTNSQILTDNPVDSNGNTSALPFFIEKDKDGKSLMSLSWVMIDFSKIKGDDIV